MQNKSTKYPKVIFLTPILAVPIQYNIFYMRAFHFLLFNFPFFTFYLPLGTIPILILRQQKDWMGEWVRKMTIIADVQYCIYADVVGGSKKVQKYADII